MNIFTSTDFIPHAIDKMDLYIGDESFNFDLIHKTEVNDCMVLKYNTGCQFIRHKHLKLADNHIGDIIVLPPVHLLPAPFTGDDLILYEEETRRIVTCELKE